MSFAYLPLFTGDYLRDTQHLSCAEHGIYLKLLMHCWDQKGPVPLDERKTCGIVNARSGDEIEAMRRVLNEFFVRMDDGHYNKRMAEEVAKSERLSKTFHEAGLKSAEARRTKARAAARSKTEPTLNQGSTLVKGRLVSPSPSPSLSSTPSPKEGEPTALVASAAPKAPSCPTETLLALYHKHLPMLPSVEVMNDGRKRTLSARWRDVVTDREIRKSPDVGAAALDWWKWYFERVAKSRFLTGKVKDWRADFDFLIAPSKFAKVVEGHYQKETA